MNTVKIASYINKIRYGDNMEQEYTTTYVLSGQGNNRTEMIAGRQQQVPAWNDWCVAINSARRAEILALVKEQNFELFYALVDDPQKSQSFFDVMASSIQRQILEKQQDVDAIEFDFEGHRIRLASLVPPGTGDNIEHYYWCCEP